MDITAHDKRRIDLDKRALLLEDVARHIGQVDEILLRDLSRQSTTRHADVEQTRDHAVHIKLRHRC